MKKILYLFAVVLLVSCVDKWQEDVNPNSQPADVIYYTSEGGKIIKPNNEKFGTNIISNTYEKGMGTITFNNPVSKIGNWTFYACRDLTRISIPHEVFLIDEYAFAACSSLVEVVVGSGVKEIGNRAFYQCHFLQKINIPERVISIGKGAFEGCYHLSEINLPSSLTSIGDSAFGVTSITSITIPDSVVEVGYAPFVECYDLFAFYGKFASEDNRCLIVDGVLNSFAPKGLTSYVISDGVKKIGCDAFQFCEELETITIPDSVIKIETAAFYGCESLKTVYCKGTIPPFLDTNIFDETPSLETIYVPMDSVGEYKSVWSPYAELIVGYYL